jgi:hypothetical protein
MSFLFNELSDAPSSVKAKVKRKGKTKRSTPFHPVISDYEAVELKSTDMRGLLKRRLDLFATSSSIRSLYPVMSGLQGRKTTSQVYAAPKHSQLNNANSLSSVQSVLPNSSPQLPKKPQSLVPLVSMQRKRRIVIAPFRKHLPLPKKEQGPFPKDLKQNINENQNLKIEFEPKRIQHHPFPSRKIDSSALSTMADFDGVIHKSRGSYKCYSPKGTKRKAPVNLPVLYQNPLMDEIDKAYSTFRAQNYPLPTIVHIPEIQKKERPKRPLSLTTRGKIRQPSSDNTDLKTKQLSGKAFNATARNRRNSSRLSTNASVLRRKTKAPTDPTLPTLRRSYSEGNLTSQDWNAYFTRLERLRDEIVTEFERKDIPLNRDEVEWGLGLRPERWYHPVIKNDRMHRIPHYMQRRHIRNKHRYFIWSHVGRNTSERKDTHLHGLIKKGLFSIKPPAPKKSQSRAPTPGSETDSDFDDYFEFEQQKRWGMLRKIMEDAVPRVEDNWTMVEVNSLTKRIEQLHALMKQSFRKKTKSAPRPRTKSATQTLGDEFRTTTYNRPLSTSSDYGYWLDGVLRSLEFLNEN